MRDKFISSIAGAAFSFAASGLAFAAPPSPPPAPVYNWTGWYVGGNVGVSLGTFKTDFNVAPSNFAELSSNGPVTVTIPGFAGFDEVYPGGFVGGGQIGFNWQLSPIWVVGVEADFQGADEKAHSTLSQDFNVAAFNVAFDFLPGTTALDYAAKIEWFGTARLRAGYLFGDGTVFSYV